MGEKGEGSGGEGGGKWGRRGRELGERGGNWEWGTPLSTPSTIGPPVIRRWRPKRKAFRWWAAADGGPLYMLTGGIYINTGPLFQLVNISDRGQKK